MLRFSLPKFCTAAVVSAGQIPLAPVTSSSSESTSLASEKEQQQQQPKNKSHPKNNNTKNSSSGSASSLRSKAGYKMIEINDSIDMFGKLEKFERMKEKAAQKKLKQDKEEAENKKSSSSSSSIVNVYSAVDFGASPGGFAQVISRNFYRKVNTGLNIPHSVITVDNRRIDPPIRNSVHIIGGMEEKGTMKRIKSTIEDCNRKFLDFSIPSSSGVVNEEEFLKPETTSRNHFSTTTTTTSGATKTKIDFASNNSTTIKHRVVLVSNDTVAIVRGNAFVDAEKKRRKYSVTYAQNNLVCCAMRRSFGLLDCFSQKHPLLASIADESNSATSTQHKPKGFGSAVRVEKEEPQRGQNQNRSKKIMLDYCPPCFFVSKILRSIHMNKVISIAEKYFDKVRVLELENSSSGVERYLVAETKPSKFLRDPIVFRHLSLPPAEGEAAEWFCWGCLTRRSGDCLKCPNCSGR